MRYFVFYLTRWVVFLGFTLIVMVFAGASTIVINRFKKQEIQRIEVIATSMKFMQDEELSD